MADVRGLSNSSLISKAAITSGSFSGAVGLAAREADRFIDYVIDQSVLLKICRVERMNNATKKIDKINIGENILVPAVSATDPGETVGIGVSQIILRAKEMIAVARISDDTLEDNIEGDAFVDHLMRMVATKVSNNLEIAYLFGNARQTAVTINDLFDGWLKQMRTGHVVDAMTDADRFMSFAKLSKAFKTLPNKFKRNRQMLRYLASPNMVEDYVQLLVAKNTPGADVAIQGEAPLRYGRIPFAEMGLVPEDMPVRTGISTTVAADSAVADTNFKVAAVAGFNAGDRITLGDPDTASYEELTVQAVGTAGAGGTGITTVEAAQYVHKTNDSLNQVTDDGTPLMLTHTLNLIVGIHRDIRVETQRWARLRATDFVLTLRSDTAVENPDACVVYDNMQVQS
jgi:hypothetical protein